MNKEEGKRLAALSFTEKIELLEKLRDRSLAFIEAREKLARQEKKPNPDWSKCDLVEVDPGRCGGRPVLRSTRMPVDDIVLNFEHGESAEEISNQFQIDVRVVKEILDYAEKS
jgi:uncharacterized protein (DUF433 family)